MVERVKTERTCPLCGTTFGSVQDQGICPSCGHSFLASALARPVEHIFTHETTRTFASILSRNDPSVLAAVEQSIRSPREYFMANQDDLLYDTPNELDPFFVAHAELVKAEYVGYIDWSSSPDETREAAAPMFAKKGVTGFDWAFFDEFVLDGDPIENERLLNIVAQKVSDLPGGHMFVWLWFGWDNYDFTVVSKNELDLLKPIRSDRFAVKQRFQPLG